MNWKDPRENRTELFILLGMVIILVGFIDLLDFHGWELIIGGLFIMGLGIYRFFKNMGKRKNKFFRWRKK